MIGIGNGQTFGHRSRVQVVVGAHEDHIDGRLIVRKVSVELRVEAERGRQMQGVTPAQTIPADQLNPGVNQTVVQA